MMDYAERLLDQYAACFLGKKPCTLKQADVTRLLTCWCCQHTCRQNLGNWWEGIGVRNPIQTSRYCSTNVWTRGKKNVSSSFITFHISTLKLLCHVLVYKWCWATILMKSMNRWINMHMYKYAYLTQSSKALSHFFYLEYKHGLTHKISW